MRIVVFKGSIIASLAAFVWSTYYVFVISIDALNPLSLFFYPALFGGVLFVGYGAYTRGKIPRPSMKRDYILPGIGYSSSQLLIVLSTVANGGVLTSTFILLGDTIISPLIVYFIGRSRFRPSPALLFPGMAVLIASAAALTLFGGTIGARSLSGVILLLLIPPALSLFFVYTNERIMAEGMAEILTPAFLSSSLFVLVYVLLTGRTYAVAFGGFANLAVLFVIGATSMFLGYILFFRASRTTGFTLSSILMALIPPFTLILGAMFLGIVATSVSIFLIILAALGAVICTLAFAEEPGVRRAGGT